MSRFRRRIKRVAVMALALLVGIGLLAAASWVTTQEDWDGGFPAGVVRLDVRTPDGQPIPAATFDTYDATGQSSGGYPFLQPITPGDANGLITVTQPRAGIQFGGHRWRLFWSIRMGDKTPRYECEIAAPGFRARRLSVFELFASAHRTEERVRFKWPERDRETELAVYDAIITLER